MKKDTLEKQPLHYKVFASQNLIPSRSKVSSFFLIFIWGLIPFRGKTKGCLLPCKSGRKCSDEQSIRYNPFITVPLQSKSESVQVNHVESKQSLHYAEKWPLWWFFYINYTFSGSIFEQSHIQNVVMDSITKKFLYTCTTGSSPSENNHSFRDIVTWPIYKI